MNDEPKISNPQPNAEPTAARSTVPMWIFSLTLVLIYLGAVYFDHHSGWFDPQVYSPYTNAVELDSYQPKSGAAAMLAQGKQNYDRFAVRATARTAWANPARHRRWPARNGSTQRDSAGHGRFRSTDSMDAITVKGQQMEFSKRDGGDGRGAFGFGSGRRADLHP